MFFNENTFERDEFYIKFHVGIGFLSGVYSQSFHSIDILFLSYQFVQYLLDVRVYLFEKKIEKGNSLRHTLDKIGDYLIGKGLAVIINS